MSNPPKPSCARTLFKPSTYTRKLTAAERIAGFTRPLRCNQKKRNKRPWITIKGVWYPRYAPATAVDGVAPLATDIKPIMQLRKPPQPAPIKAPPVVPPNQLAFVGFLEPLPSPQSNLPSSVYTKFLMTAAHCSTQTNPYSTPPSETAPRVCPPTPCKTMRPCYI